MRQKLTIGFLILVFALPTMARDMMQGKFDYDKFKAEKVAFFTEAISLTPDEAQVFWPVYNEFEKKRWELGKERRELDQSLKQGIKEMSDKEYIDLTRKVTSLHLQESKLMEEYNEQFLKILPPKKVVQLYVAELNFRNQLLRKYKGDHNRPQNKK